MAKIDELRKMIAKTLKVDVSDIDYSFSMKTGKLRTSAGSVILGNMVKKVYGKKIDCKSITTFGELVKVVEDNSEESSKGLVKEPVVIEEEKHTLIMTGNPICGIDIQEIEIFPQTDDYWTESFYTDNFTNEEIAYCSTASNPRHSFAGRWCIKEALHKCSEKYYSIPLKDIRVVKQKSGAVTVEIKHETEWIELQFGCSLSHSENYAVGIVTGFE